MLKHWIKLTFLVWLVIMPEWLIGQNLPQTCGGKKVRYTVKGLESSVFQWEVTGGQIIENYNNSVDIKWDNNEGIHAIKVTEHNVLACTGDPVYGYVMVSDPKLHLEKNAELCEGQVYKLKVDTNYKSINWSSGSTDSFILVNQAGYYKVEVTFPNGCRTKDSTLVIIYPKPIFSLGKDTMACQGESITLDPQVIASTYLWSTGETSPTINVKANAGLVWARLTNIYGCFAVDTIQIKPCTENTIKKLIPNAFTPNNDNDNDTWRIDILANYPEASVSIYNRWGQLVYKTDNYPTQGWDGISNGKPLPMDTYFYIIDLKDGYKPLLGSVNLIR